MEQAFFSSWTSITRVLLVGVAAYAGLLLLLRVSGKRTLTRMNAFDLVVTVALGSTLATVLLTKSVALADGLVASTLLIFLQYGLTWLSVRSPGGKPSGGGAAHAVGVRRPFSAGRAQSRTGYRGRNPGGVAGPGPGQFSGSCGGGSGNRREPACAPVKHPRPSVGAPERAP